MTRVLGISALFHDAAAALAEDGRIVAAVQEERLSRKKNDASLPLAAARACLAKANLRPEQLDLIAYYEDPVRRATRTVVSCFRNFPRAVRQFPLVMGNLPRTLFAPLRLAEGLGVAADRVITLDHHLCHAAAAFHASGYPEAAILIADGVGEETSTSWWHAHGGELVRRGESLFPHSLGLFYAAVTAWLGFEVNEGEYKVMGLAAFGTPRYADLFRRWVHVHEGQVRLAPAAFAYETDTRWGFGAAFVDALGPPRPADRAWDLTGGRGRDRNDADVACSAQLVLEECLLALAAYALQQSGSRTLVLGGGVALNAKAIGALHAAKLAERIFVPPGAGDAGAAMGAAWLAGLERGAAPIPLESAFLGSTIDAERATALAIELDFEPLAGDPAQQIAQAIVRREIVAVAHGALEFGPRALGHRSLLAAPGPVEIREHLNRVVKRREPFRPFAPVVRARDVSRFFHGEANDCTPWMTTVLPVRAAARADLAAVVHADGTARVQSVTSGLLFDVLDALERQGALPVVLNTSLNGQSEPICAGAEDAVAFFAAHAVDLLVLGDRIYRKRRSALVHDAPAEAS